MGVTRWVTFLEAVGSKVYWRLPLGSFGIGKIADPLEVEGPEFLESQFVVGVSHDDDYVTGSRQDLLVFPENFPEESPCPVTFNSVAYPAGSYDPDPLQSVGRVFLYQELEEEIPSLERLPQVSNLLEILLRPEPLGAREPHPAKLGGEALATFPSACPDDGATGFGGHAGTEAELAGALDFGGSVSGFHRLFLPMGLCSGNWGKGEGGKGLAGGCQGLYYPGYDFPLSAKGQLSKISIL